MAISVPKVPEVRVNERIRVPQVRVIGDDGEQVGVLATREAIDPLQRALTTDPDLHQARFEVFEVIS